MPNDAKSRVGKEEHEKRRIKGSLFWNVDEVATKGDEVRNLPHMAPTGEVFAKAAGESYSCGILREKSEAKNLWKAVEKERLCGKADQVLFW